MSLRGASPKQSSRMKRLLCRSLQLFTTTYLFFWFTSAKDGELIDTEVTIHFLIADLAQPLTLQFSGRKDVGGFVRTVLVLFRDLLEGACTTILLLNGIPCCYIVIFKQINIELRCRRNVLDVNKPAVRLEQGKDLFIDLLFA